MPISDSEWIRLREEQHRHIVEPFLPDQCRAHSDIPAISYGLSSAGYDLRLDGHSLAIVRGGGIDQGGYRGAVKYMGTIDPKRVDKDQQFDVEHPIKDEETGELFWKLAPGDYALGLSLEYITIPRDHLGLCIGKSTYARCGLIINTTPLEPEWHGRLVIELYNSLKSHYLKVYAWEGIAQLLLMPVQGEVRTSYADKDGKYQGQDVITYARV